MNKIIYTQALQDSIYQFWKKAYNNWWTGTEQERALKLAGILRVDEELIKAHFSENGAYRRHGDIVALILNSFYERQEGLGIIIRE